MVDQIRGKKVPWPQLEEYLATHQQTIVAFVDLKNRHVLDVPEIEAKLPNSFMQLHEIITRIVRENNILPNEEESKVDQLEVIVKIMFKLISTLIRKNPVNREEIKNVIRSMKNENVSQKEVSTMLEKLAGLSEIIAANLSEL